MLIKFKDIVNKYGLPKGVIHIGAHLMEERDDYISHDLKNTIWIEANPETFNKINFINSELCTEKAYNYAISDVDDEIVILNITNNGQSSSILELEKHKIHHPHIFVTEKISVSSKRLDSLVLENDINIKDYDFLNIDIQGAELLALRGMGDLLSSINYIYTEVNVSYLYKDCALIGEIDEYLSKFDFERVETLMTDAEWGDAFYVKKNKI